MVNDLPTEIIVPFSNAFKNSTLAVRVRVTGLFIGRIRVCLGLCLIRLAAFVIGIKGIEVKKEEDDG